MQVETLCTRCRKKLLVPSSSMDQDVRCPHCEFVFTVVVKPSYPMEPVVLGPPPSGDECRRGVTEHPFYLRIPEGRVFGPLARNTLDRWVEEGRVSADCEIRVGDSGDWQAAIIRYPILRDQGNPFGQDLDHSGVRSFAPHRGKLIFSLAILGCFVPFLSLWPAIWGTNDIRRMHAGTMDPAGDTWTRSGQAVAMVSSMIWLAAFGLGMLVLLLRLFAG